MDGKTDVSVGVWMVAWTDGCPVLSMYVAQFNRTIMTR